jgi:hypothetical protein
MMINKNMEYEKYLKGLIVRAKRTQGILDEWRRSIKKLRPRDLFILGEMSRLIGYCLGLENVLENKKLKKQKDD